MTKPTVDKLTPPPELVQQWMDEFYGGPGALITSEEAFMAMRAATWGYWQCWDTYAAAAARVLPQDDFDALQHRLAELGLYDPRVAKVLSTPAPWDEPCDKTSTSADQ